MAMITSALIKALFTSYRKEYQGGLTAVTPTYEKIATVIPSTTASNTYGWLGQFPRFREWVGERVIKDMQASGYTIVNKLFESTVGVKRTDIEDDAVGVYSPLFQEMGRAAASYPDEHVYGLLNAAKASLCFDGQFFFDTDHPVYPNVDGTGAVVPTSNLIAGSDADVGPTWYLLDCSRAVKPLIFQRRIAPELTPMTAVDDENVFMLDEYRYGARARSNVGFGFWQMAVCSNRILTPESFDQAYDLMRSFKGDGGRPLDLKATLLVVPSTLRSKANETVKVARLANGADNPNYNIVEVLDSGWLNN
jgi:phage major head subunit gpT-like protein